MIKLLLSLKKNKLKLFAFLSIFFTSNTVFTCCFSNDSVQTKSPNTIASIVSELYHAKLDDVSIQLIENGFSGDSLYLLRHCNNAAVLRIHKAEKSFADKKLEWEATNIAAQLKIGPRILYNSEDFSAIVTEFIEAPHPKRDLFADEDKLDLLVQSLKKLHNGPELSKDWLVFEYIKGLIPERLNDRQKLAMEKFGEIEDAFRIADFPKKTCHNDFHPGNLFFVNNRILFIDWGDSGMGDPYWDFARISTEFLFDIDQDKNFLVKFLGKASSLEYNRLFIMKQIFILQFALRNSNMDGNPVKEDLDTILKVFEINSFPFTEDKDHNLISWQDVANHAIELFLHNSNSATFQNALKQISESKT